MYIWLEFSPFCRTYDFKKILLFLRSLVFLFLGNITCNQRSQNCNFSLFVKVGEKNKAFGPFYAIGNLRGLVSILGGLVPWHLSGYGAINFKKINFLSGGVGLGPFDDFTLK